jgi:hypothetical protein
VGRALNKGFIPTFSWTEWEKNMKNTIQKIDGASTEVRSGQLPNICQSITGCAGLPAGVPVNCRRLTDWTLRLH